MNAANIALEYLKVLVWPLVVAGVLIGYRRTAQRLLTRLIQVDAAGVSATFDRATEQATEVTGSAAVEPSTSEQKAALESSFRIKPTAYFDARTFGQEFREGKAVLLDLTEIADADAKRLVDFSAGLTFQARGSMDKIANRVFLLEH